MKWVKCNTALSLVFCSAIPSFLFAGTESLHYIEQVLSIRGKSYTVQIPQGYRLELLTPALDSPRMLTFAANGDLFIGSSSRSGKIYRLAPPYRAPEVLATLNDYPHSLVLRKDEILIAGNSGLYRAAYQLGQARIDSASIKRLAPLPGGRGHSSRTVAIGPDGRVYVSLGISSNCSDQYLGGNYELDDRRGGIVVLRETGGEARWETFASGLRNPVGFAWHPKTGTLYASNNGPDHLGFNEPPEYFSRLDAGSFHGMPWFQYIGGRIVRDDCIKSAPPRPAQDVKIPAATFPARNAPLGLTFVPDGALDKNLALDAIVALHGSWATNPSGGAFGNAASRRPPKVVAVRFDSGTPRRVDDLITGFQLANGERWARPAGVAIGPDGALYFTSDDEVEGLFRLIRAP